MPNLPLWFNRGTILPDYNWQDFSVSYELYVNLAKITFEPFNGDSQIYPDGIKRYCMFRRKWLSPSTMTEEAFFLWPQPEAYVKQVTAPNIMVNVGFVQYQWQCRLLPARNEQVYYVNIQEM